MRADRSAAGTLPTRAFRYCEPVAVASAFGYYVFPPMAFSVMWDGHHIVWQHPTAPSWQPLHTAQFPGFADTFDSLAPEPVRGYSPPFLAALQEPGLLQVWTGLIVRTAPGWSLLVRGCANLPRHGPYEPFEGVIETDRWFGPLITNLRLTKTDVPITFQPDFPFLQVQPLPQAALSPSSTEPSLTDLAAMDRRDWDDFARTVVRPSIDPERKRGEYAVESRKRRD